MKLKVMTFNTQHCRNFITGKIDFDVMAKAINTCGADIVGLNEMRNIGHNTEEYDDQVRILSEKTGLSYYYFAEAIRFGGKNPYGNGILSRYPITNAHAVIIPDPPKEGRDKNGYYETRCVLCASLDVGFELNVRVSHFGLMPEERENAVWTLTENLPMERCVLMGDFNMKPDDKMLIPIRARMNDTAKTFDGEKLSFPSDNPTEKIDYIFVSRDIEVLTADIPPIIASDHRPHTAEIIVR